jgi:hypothetical protein
MCHRHSLSRSLLVCSHFLEKKTTVTELWTWQLQPRTLLISLQARYKCAKC